MIKNIKGLLISSITAGFLLAGCGSSSTAAETAPAATPAPHASSAPSADSIAIGDTVIFGRYKDQDIRWYVLSQKDGKVLLLSVDALDSRPFDDNAVTWDHSALRKWLNDAFYNEAFDADQQQAVQLSTLENGDDLGYGTKVGENTEDHVFLLSASEAEKNLTTEETVTAPTAYALSQGAYTNADGNCAWWLRSPGMSDEGPAYYSSQGEIGTRAHKGSESIIGVRPAVWVSADALK